MADEETQTNVVQFPRKYVGVAPKVTNFDAMKLNKELQFADELTDGIMVSMIHNMDDILRGVCLARRRARIRLLCD